jgi:hypothetical protein
VRIGNPLLSQTLFPVYVALLLWGGLWLRDEGSRGERVHDVRCRTCGSLLYSVIHDS